MTSEPMVYVEAGLIKEVTDILARYGIKGASDALNQALDRAQPPAGEPAAWECFYGGYVSLSYEKEEDSERTVPLFRIAPPAAAHGDEAVRALAGMTGLYGTAQDELDAARKDAERYRWLRSKADAQDLRFPLIGKPSEIDQIIDAAMRAQAGEGGEV